jgi:triacylglycerol esterase/lipase EstA (alpha/beta hydrolase family)
MKIPLRRAIFVGLLATAAVIFFRPSRDVGSRNAEEDPVTPVLLVHGMFGSGKDLGELQHYLETRGFSPIVAMDLSANDGTVGVADLSAEVATAVEQLRKNSGRPRIDIVGYSMGAMVSRYYIQRRGGKDTIRRFVSIAGPHHGVVAGLLTNRPGGRDMRPESALVQDLESDQDPFGAIDVFDFWFPLDPIIVPSFSAILRGARLSCPFLVKSHHDMIHDERTQAAVAEVLRTGTLAAKDGCTEKR